MLTSAKVAEFRVKIKKGQSFFLCGDCPKPLIAGI